MVRSNFDYTNRTSGGEKLGASIASDLRKKATQTVKPHKTPSKSSKSAPKSKAAQELTSSPCKANALTKLDIKIPDKTLTDAGFGQIADALVDALAARPDLMLTELNLASNGLTYRSLDGLARVIQQSPELLSLDLSNNSIKIDSNDAAAAWSKFVDACWSCPSVFQLNISGNEELGALAFERIARIAVTRWTSVPARRDSHQGSHCDSGAESTEQKSTSSITETAKVEGNTSNDTDDGDLHRPPEIANAIARSLTAKNVSMDDHAVIFASAIMLGSPNPASQVNLIYDEDTNDLTKDGAHLLDLVRKLRTVRENSRKLDALQTESEHDQEDGDSVGNQVTEDAAYWESVGTTANDEAAILADIDRSTKKIQRNVIMKSGHTNVELWAAATHVFAISRKIYVLAVSFARMYETKCQPREKSGTASDTASRSQRPEPSNMTARQLGFWSIIGPRVMSATKPRAPKVNDLTNSMRALGSLGTSDTEWTGWNRNGMRPNGETQPTSFRTIRRPPRRSNPVMTTQRNDEQSGQKYTERQKQHLASLQRAQGGASNGYRDPSLKCQLPLTVCNLILSFAADEQHLAVLSKRQRTKAFEWGQLHDSLKTEHDWRNRDTASQVWMLLEALECLEYEHDE